MNPLSADQSFDRRQFDLAALATLLRTGPLRPGPLRPGIRLTPKPAPDLLDLHLARLRARERAEEDLRHEEFMAG